MKDMNITDKFESSMFFIWVKISQVVAFSGLGEAQNISLATENGCLQQIKKECNIYIDHQKNIFDSRSEV